MNFVSVIFFGISLFATGPRHNDKLAESLIEFRIENAGIEVSGVIDEVQADINFNEKNLAESTIIAKAQPLHIRTGIPIRDRHLKRSDYFHADRFPEITLTSTSFQKVGRHKFLGTFILMIKNFKKELTIPFSIEHRGDAIIYSGAFEINRLSFGLGEESLILDNIVKVFVTASVKKSSGS